MGYYDCSNLIGILFFCKPLTTYYLSHELLILSVLIAATAMTLNSPLLSKNQRDYRFIPALNLLPYP
jgi:hypothetical protein